MTKEQQQPVGMSPLQALITGRMREKGWDAKTVEERGVKHATLHRYMNPLTMKGLPRDNVIESLARGLDLDEEIVRSAAWRSLEKNRGRAGDEPMPTRPAQPVGLGLDAEAADLAPEQVEAVLVIIRGMKPS